MTLTDKQSKVLDFIKQFEINKGKAPTQKEIKEYMGLKSFGSVQKYLLYLKEQGLIDKEFNARRGIKTSGISAKHSSLIEIPLLGKVAAGVPILAVESLEDKLAIPKALLGLDEHSSLFQKVYFALKIEGESMIDAHIKSGDLAICEKNNNPKNGDIVVALLEDEATLKYFYSKNKQIELRPANDQFKSLFITEQPLVILGVLKALWRQF